MTYLHKPQTVWLRRALFQVHLWVGVTAGLYVFVVCVTGAALIFRIDMQRALFPELFTAGSSAPPADAATMLEHVRRAFPNDRVSGIDAPTTTRPTYLAYVTRGNAFQTFLFDPHTGRLLGELPTESWLRVLQELHLNLLTGRTGRVVNGIGAACLAIMALTGVVIWWPGLPTWRRALTVDFRRGWRRINFDVHRAVGFYASAFVLMWAVTGVFFVWPQEFRSLVRRVAPLTVTGTIASSVPADGAPKAPWPGIIEKARATLPGQHLARVVVPSSDTAPFLVMFSTAQPAPGGAPLASVYLDQYSTEILQVSTANSRTVGDRVMAWLGPLHMGNFAGNGIRMVWFVLGVAPALLAVTGLVMWWTRVIRPRWRAALAGPAGDAALADSPGSKPWR